MPPSERNECLKIHTDQKDVDEPSKHVGRGGGPVGPKPPGESVLTTSGRQQKDWAVRTGKIWVPSTLHVTTS